MSADKSWQIKRCIILLTEIFSIHKIQPAYGYHRLSTV